MRGSWQAALLGIPFGGAFGGVRIAPGTADDESLGLLRLYLEELASPPGHVDLIGPGLGSASAHEALLNDPDLGPCSPMLADVPAWATAAGLGTLLDAVAPDAGVDLPGASVVIQGFGVLGRCVATSLHHRGLRILAVSDEHGGILNTDGLDIDALLSHVKSGHPLRRFPDATSLTNEELLRFPCDLLIPAAIANQITPENAAQLQCSLIAEMACGAVTIEADEILRERGIDILPAILANAGGLIYSYLRHTSPEMDRHEITKSISNRVLKALSEAQSLAAAADLDLRSAATTCALKALQEST
jgi:glutamate dehydrogenase/leucine dehydrogenase